MSASAGSDASHGAAPADRLRQGLAWVRAQPLDERQVAARRLGEAARQVIDRLMATTAPAEVLLQAAVEAEALAITLGHFAQNRGYEGFAEAAGAGPGRAFFDWSPQLGLANPLAPPIDIDVEGDAVVGRARFGSAYEGPPGCVHGGHVAAAFDEVLGMTQSLGGKIGMTGTLTVRYRRPTPLHTDLRFEGHLIEVQGRKVLTRGTVAAAGTMTAEAEAIFVTVSSERFEALADRRAKGPGG